MGRQNTRIIDKQKKHAVTERSYSQYMEAQKAESDYNEILKVAFDPSQFKDIWQKCPPLAKLQFIQNSMRYVFSDKTPQQPSRDTQSVELVEKILSIK